MFRIEYDSNDDNDDDAVAASLEDFGRSCQLNIVVKGGHILSGS